MGQMDAIFGATLVGTVVTAWLLGLICVLSFQYYTKYPRDPLITKILVGFVWFLQGLTAADLTAMLYYYLITSFNMPQNLTSMTWSWSTFIILELVCQAITASCVQFFYAQRVFALSRSYMITGVVVILSISQLAFGLGTAGVTIRLKFFDKVLPRWTWMPLCWVGCTAACDIAITVTQVFYLVRNPSNIPQTRKMVATLLVSIIATGVLTAVAAIVELFTFAFVGFNFVHDFLNYTSGSVYAISLLANLHIRRIARGDMSNVVAMESPLHFRQGTAVGQNQSSQLTAWVSTTREDDSTLGQETSPEGSHKWQDDNLKPDVNLVV